jgi:hypothetical protein
MAYLLLSALGPVVVLAWSGRLVAASSEQARRKLLDTGVAPATRPPSALGVLLSGVVVVALLCAVALLTL